MLRLWSVVQGTGLLYLLKTLLILLPPPVAGKFFFLNIRFECSLHLRTYFYTQYCGLQYATGDYLCI